MYFWKIDKLIQDIKDEKVTEKENVKYFIVSVLLYSVFSNPLLTMDMENDLLDVIAAVISVLTFVIGTYYIYTINKKGDNKNFITRYFCLSIPIGIRLFVVLMVIGLIQGVLFTENWPGFDDTETVYEQYEPYKTDLESLSFHIFSELFFIIYMAYSVNKIQLK